MKEPPMKKISVYALAACSLCASSAHALEVTNLDTIDHKVLFESSGSKEVHLIKAGDTEYISGQPNGFISLLSAEDPKPNKGTVHADGMLSGIIGGERTEGIPAETNDSVVIWKGGHIGIQQRRRGGMFDHG